MVGCLLEEKRQKMNSFQKIADLLTAILAFFLLPVCYSNMMLGDIREVAGRESVRNFVSFVQEQGMLTQTAYQKFAAQIFHSKEQGEIFITIERTTVALGKENQVEQYREELFMPEILNLLQKYGKIRMQKGDCIKVIVNLQGNSNGIFQEKHTVTAAGYIRNENWRILQN